MLSLLARPLFWIYRNFFSPAIHLWAGTQAGCRFEPTCSVYAKEALETHGLFRGFWLASSRVCRCHPFSSGGIDLVPRYDIGSTRKVNANGS